MLVDTINKPTAKPTDKQKVNITCLLLIVSVISVIPAVNLFISEISSILITASQVLVANLLKLDPSQYLDMFVNRTTWSLCSLVMMLLIGSVIAGRKGRDAAVCIFIVSTFFNGYFQFKNGLYKEPDLFVITPTLFLFWATYIAACRLKSNHNFIPTVSIITIVMLTLSYALSLIFTLIKQPSIVIQNLIQTTTAHHYLETFITASYINLSYLFDYSKLFSDISLENTNFPILGMPAIACAGMLIALIFSGSIRLKIVATISLISVIFLNSYLIMISLLFFMPSFILVAITSGALFVIIANIIGLSPDHSHYYFYFDLVQNIMRVTDNAQAQNLLSACSVTVLFSFFFSLALVKMKNSQVIAEQSTKKIQEISQQAGKTEREIFQQQRERPSSLIKPN